MANCKNCGRELPNFSAGESSDLCSECLSNNIEVLPPQTQPRRVVLPRRRVTQVIIGINVMVYLAMVMSGASPVEPTNAQLLQFGATWGPASLGAQPWRLLTSNYVHVGIIHIALSMWCLWDLGALSELIFGAPAYFLIYLLCGLGGSIASAWWHPMVVGAGASGAIFGLAGVLIAAIYLGHLPFPKEALKRTLRSLFVFAGYNLFFGAVVAHVDNSAHIGGLVTGLVIGALLASRLHDTPGVRLRWARLMLSGVAVFLLAAFVQVKRVNGYVVPLGQAVTALQQGKIDDAIAAMERATVDNPKEPTSFFLLGSAYLEKDEFAKAETTLQKAIDLKPGYFGAQFNLGLAQMKLGKQDQAAQSLQAATRSDPKNPDAYQALAEVLHAQGKNTEADAAMQKAQSLRRSGN
ncbi:MAG TPA: rhomboid family intramembrane serine protease [Terriglobales bacterium]|nr:rhomboid family intramembrane serine protease [Terriglobales bacterium]